MDEQKSPHLSRLSYFRGEIIATLKVVGIYSLCGIPMLAAMAFTTLNTQPERTLDDALFKIIPFHPYYSVPEWILAVIITTTSLPVLFLAPTHLLYGLRSTLLFLSPLYLFRSLTISATLMPDPYGLCLATSPLTKDILNGSIVEIIQAHFSGKLRLCADLIFSGHTLTAGYMLYLIAHLYRLPKLKPYRSITLKFVSFLYCVLIYNMLACRFHYTVDVLVAAALLILGLIAHDSVVKLLIPHHNWYTKLLYANTMEEYGVIVSDNIFLLAPGVVPEGEVVVTETKTILYKGIEKGRLKAD